MTVVLGFVLALVWVTGVVLGITTGSITLLGLSLGLAVVIGLLVYLLWIRAHLAVVSHLRQRPHSGELPVAAEGLAYAPPEAVAAPTEVEGPLLLYVGARGVRFEPPLPAVGEMLAVEDAMTIKVTRAVPFPGFSKVVRIVTPERGMIDVYLLGKRPLWITPPSDRDVEAIAEAMRRALPA
ncbi:MAG: hypothetical protein J0I43_09770 [Microbacterium sp.]|uniref:hypothetical protein n=1 Tax=Microbacterium sp. TaxID=51671 RepID=UPI001AC97521|nr:hypothetical protein [Microbacterium sp.]MBN9177639.1 hypothetical protein [Microbacterium sp.]